jgi:hypothetical protein
MMMSGKAQFTLSRTGDGKHICIDGPNELWIEVENDDVCDDQQPAAQQIVDILNAHWQSVDPAEEER